MPIDPDARKIISDGTETPGAPADKAEQRHKVPAQSLIIGQGLC